MSPTDDLGAPISYLALEEGTAVFAADGDEVGHVAHVLAVEEEDIFDGIVISTASAVTPSPTPSRSARSTSAAWR